MPQPRAVVDPGTIGRAGRFPAARPARFVAAAAIVTLGALAARHHAPEFSIARAASTTVESTSTTSSTLPALGKREPILELLGCTVRSTFDVRAPALEGFSCRAAAGSITVFRYPTAPSVLDIDHKRGRACHYAARAGRNLAWIAVGGDWLGWTLTEETLANVQSGFADVSTIVCEDR